MRDNLLAIDSSNGFLSLALFENKKFLRKEVVEVKSNLSDIIFKKIEDLLKAEKKSSVN